LLAVRDSYAHADWATSFHRIRASDLRADVHIDLATNPCRDGRSDSDSNPHARAAHRDTVT
jgi:hypothetical protein